MKEHPILFSAPMVRAILEGHKTVTRRVVKPLDAVDVVPFIGADNQPTGEFGWCPHPSVIAKHIHCPCGRPGDRLWLREAWRSIAELDHLSGSVMAEACVDAGYHRPWAPIQYQADLERVNWEHTGGRPLHSGPPEPGRYRHARFMPRWASRITLEVTGVRVERLQDISEADAIAEGLHTVQIGSGYPDCYSAEPMTWAEAVEQVSRSRENPRFAFHDLWESINGVNSWNSNPWVWCVSFRRIQS